MTDTAETLQEMPAIELINGFEITRFDRYYFLKFLDGLEVKGWDAQLPLMDVYNAFRNDSWSTDTAIGLKPEQFDHKMEAKITRTIAKYLVDKIKEGCDAKGKDGEMIRVVHPLRQRFQALLGDEN